MFWMFRDLKQGPDDSDASSLRSELCCSLKNPIFFSKGYSANPLLHINNNCLTTFSLAVPNLVTLTPKPQWIQFWQPGTLIIARIKPTNKEWSCSNSLVHDNELWVSWVVNCHVTENLTLRKIAIWLSKNCQKPDIFSKKIAQNFHFFQKNCHWLFFKWKMLAIFLKKCQVFGNFLNSYGNFPEGQVRIIQTVVHFWKK